GLAGERIARPGARAERDHVDVAGEAQRAPGVARAQAGDDARALVLVLEVLHREAPFLEHRADAARALALPSGRVDGIEVHELAREGQDVGSHACMIRRLRCASCMATRMAKNISDPRKQEPEQPFPPQEQEPPGLEKDMRPRPDYGEKTYKG